jgi:hypothetical protein
MRLRELPNHKTSRNSTTGGMHAAWCCWRGDSNTPIHSISFNHSVQRNAVKLLRLSHGPEMLDRSFQVLRPDYIFEGAQRVTQRPLNPNVILTNCRGIPPLMRAAAVAVAGGCKEALWGCGGKHGIVCIVPSDGRELSCYELGSTFPKILTNCQHPPLVRAATVQVQEALKRRTLREYRTRQARSRVAARRTPQRT